MALDVDPLSDPITGVWYRYIPEGGDPEYEPEHPSDARFQHGTVVEGLYFAESEGAMFAEMYRWMSEAGVPPSEIEAKDCWEWELSLPPAGIADLSTQVRLNRVGLSLPKPTRRDWPPSQSVGDQLWRDGWTGLVFPSACKVDARVVCLFRDQKLMPGTRPIPPPTTYDADHLPPIPPGLRT